MGASTHTSVRLSAELRALLALVAPQTGDRAAALRALAILGAHAAGLPIETLIGDLSGLLSVPLHPQVRATLTAHYLAVGGGDAVGEHPPAPGGAPAAHATHTAGAPPAHAAHTAGAPPAHAAASVARSHEAADADPFAIGLEV